MRVQSRPGVAQEKAVMRKLWTVVTVLALSSACHSKPHQGEAHPSGLSGLDLSEYTLGSASQSVPLSGFREWSLDPVILAPSDQLEPTSSLLEMPPAVLPEGWGKGWSPQADSPRRKQSVKPYSIYDDLDPVTAAVFWLGSEYVRQSAVFVGSR